MICVSLSLGQILSILGAIAVMAGLLIVWVDTRRAANVVRMERAKRGLFEHPDSFTAIDEAFHHRRRRPISPPPAPPRGPVEHPPRKP